MFTITPGGPIDPSTGRFVLPCQKSGVPVSLMGNIAVLWGTIPSSVAAKVCTAIVNQGKFTFSSSITSLGQTITPTLNLASTGGCGSSGSLSNPSFVQVHSMLYLNCRAVLTD